MMSEAMHPAGTRIDIPDGELTLYAGAFAPAEADGLLAALLEHVPWRQESVRMFGRDRPSPRLTAWFGDPAARYAYSGVSLEPLPWSPPVLAARGRAEALAGARFNGVLLNLYRDGRDGVGWHSDAERSLGPRPTIASVSLGAERRFLLRHRRTAHSVALLLPHGSVLVMAGDLQHAWRHALPKTRAACAPRVNLTFRRIVGSAPVA
jgi:alkylated DNA repair dioxygenase AlkB